MRGIDHPPITHEYPNVRNIIRAVAAIGPENEVTSFGFGTWDMFPHGGVVLGMSSSWDGFINGLADGILCQPWNRGQSWSCFLSVNVWYLSNQSHL